MHDFLVDECLTLELVTAAHNRGYSATHVAQRGWAGLKDWQLLPFIEQNGLLFVTNDRTDWLALHGGLQIHAGLIVLVTSVSRHLQVRLFNAALTALAEISDLLNQVFEIGYEYDSSTVLLRPLSASGA